MTDSPIVRVMVRVRANAGDPSELAPLGLAGARCGHNVPLVESCDDCLKNVPTGYRLVGPGCPFYRAPSTE